MRTTNRCPSCNLINPADAYTCDCGHNFFGSTRDYTRHYRRKDEANGWLDFVLGMLWLVGLIIVAIRYNDNEINWPAFIAGLISGSIVSIFMLCGAIAASAASS